MLGSLIPTCSNCGRVLPEDGSPCPSCALPSPAVTAPAGDAPEGLVAGRSLLQRRLGRGAAKDVWLAHDLTLDRAVALARVSGPAAWERLRREARLTAPLRGHPHTVTRPEGFGAARRPPAHRHRPRRLRRRRHAVPGRPLHDRRLARRPALTSFRRPAGAGRGDPRRAG